MVIGPVLKSSRLILTPFSDRHLTERYVNWLNDKATMRYSEQRHRMHSLQSCLKYAHSMAEGAHFFWAIEATRPDIGHIGNVSAYVDRPNRVADLAIMIGEAEARGYGFGLEAWQTACDYLLSEGGMRKVTAGTMAVNQPMLRIMQASGMIEEGRRRRQFLFEGQEVDLVTAARFSQLT